MSSQFFKKTENKGPVNKSSWHTVCITRVRTVATPVAAKDLAGIDNNLGSGNAGNTALKSRCDTVVKELIRNLTACVEVAACPLYKESVLGKLVFTNSQTCVFETTKKHPTTLKSPLRGAGRRTSFSHGSGLPNPDSWYLQDFGYLS